MNTRKLCYLHGDRLVGWSWAEYRAIIVSAWLILISNCGLSQFGTGAGSFNVVTVGSIAEAHPPFWDATSSLSIFVGAGKPTTTKDAFESTYQLVSGDYQIVAQITALETANDSARAGLVIRESPQPEARQIWVAKDRKQNLFLYWRGKIAAPVEFSALGNGSELNWLKLVRRGNWIGVYGSTKGDAWTVLDWRILELPEQVIMGVAVGYESDGSAAQAKFSGLAITPSATNHPLPVMGEGMGLLGEYYTNASLVGEAALIKVDRSIDFNWGLGCPVGLPKNQEFGIRWTGELQAQFTEPYTLYLESDDGARLWLNDELVIDAWQERWLKESQATVNLIAGQRYRLRVEYFDKTEAAAIYFRWSSPSTTRRIVPQSQLFCPVSEGAKNPPVNQPSWADYTADAANLVDSDWKFDGIGAGGGGAVVGKNGIFLVRGVGKNIWGRNDSFYYVYQPVAGDLQITAKILAINCNQPWAKAGLMFRESLDPKAKQVALFGTAGHGLLFNYRNKTGGATYDSTDLRYDVPHWIKIVRQGNSLSGYASTNGADWRLVDRVIVDMPRQVYVGLAVCSRADQSECSAWFEEPIIQEAESVSELPITGQGDGLKTEFFNSPNVTGAVTREEVQTRLDFQADGRLPFSGYAGGRFSVRWSGEIEARFSEPHTFRLLANYRGRVWLNENLIIDAIPGSARQAGEPEIDLVAGRKYLIRVEVYDARVDAKVRLLWSSPSTVRRTIPPSQFYSHPDDTDGDGLPDLWEIAYELDPHDPADAALDLDNDGLTNLEEYRYGTHPRMWDSDHDLIPDGWAAKHGLNPTLGAANNPDLDHDGLTNLQEYQLGLDPLNPDTDGDGLLDGIEALEIGSDASNAGGLVTTVLAELKGDQTSENLGRWHLMGTAIRAEDERGELRWLWTNSIAGMFRLDVVGGLGIKAPLNLEFPLEITVDGEAVGRTVIQTVNGVDKAGIVFLPWLAAGRHEIKILWDNSLRLQPRLLVEKIQIKSVAGADDDKNGKSDWIDYRLAHMAGLLPAANEFIHYQNITNDFEIESLISPAMIEGRERYLGMLKIQADENALRPVRGIDGKWSVNVPLNPSQASSCRFSFQNGGLKQNAKIRWKALNLLATNLPPVITLRSGDALLLTGVRDDATGGKVQIDIEGINRWEGDAGAAIIQRFDETGSFNIHATYVGRDGFGIERHWKINVISVSFEEPVAAWIGHERKLAAVKLFPPHALEGDGDLHLNYESGPENGASNLTISATQPGGGTVQARLGGSGAILTNLWVQSFRLQTGLDTYVHLMETFEDGSQMIEMGFVMYPVVPTVEIELRVIVAGVLFEDGTVTHRLKAQDFDELGRAAVRFIRPASARTSVCHSITVFQGDKLLGYLR